MRLEDACELIVDCPHTTAPDEGWGYPLVRTPNIGLGRLVFDNMHRVSESVYKQRNKRATPRAGDLIYAREAMPGNVALLLPGQEVCLGQRTVLIRPNNAIVESAYLTYLLLSNECRNKLVGTANGATVLHVNIPAIRNFDITLPPLPTQRKIAKVLSAYDDLIENNTKRIRILERMAEELYKEWFVRFRFPGHEKAKFVNGLPEGWRVERLGDWFYTSSGGTPSRKHPEYFQDGCYMWVKTGELFDRFVIETEERITEDAVRDSAAKLIKAGSLLCSMYAGVGKLGFAAESMTCSQATCVFWPKSYATNYYLFFFLKLNRTYLENISTGAAQQNISQEVIKKIKWFVPGRSLVDEFTKHVSAVYASILLLQRQNALLARQRDLLLPRLMSGRLSVEGVKES